MEFLEKIRNSNRLPKWDISPIDFGLFICFVLAGSYLLSGLIIGAYSQLSGDEVDFESLPFVIASGLGLQLGGLLAWFLFKRFVTFENKNQPEGIKASITIGVIGFICVYLALIPTMFAWKAALDFLNFEHEYQLPVLLVQNGGSPLEMGMLALLIVVVAPLCEEIVYRGFLFRYLNERLPMGYAVSLSAALFALMHMNLYSALPLFILGATLCLVYKRSGNLVSSITIHALFNSVNLAMIYFIEPIPL